MPSEKRDRQRQNRIGGRAADLEAARAAKKRKSARNGGIAVAVVAALVIILALANSGGGDDDKKTDVAANDDTTANFGDDDKKKTTTTTAEGATTSAPPTTTATPSTTAIPAAGGGDLDKIACNDTKPAAPPSTKQYDQPGDAKIDPAKTYIATMETSCGKIVIELDAKAAPKTVNSIVFLAREGFYDGTKFHRVVDDFVIQGGDPEGTGTGGPGYDMAEEPPADKTYETGDLAMAKTSAPNSTGSQFFIVTGSPAALDQSPTYSYAGKVTEGLDVAQKMESFNQGDGPPTRELYLFKVTITEK